MEHFIKIYSIQANKASTFQRNRCLCLSSVLEGAQWSSSRSKDVGQTLFPIRPFAASMARCSPFIPWHSRLIRIGFFSTSERLVLHYIRCNSHRFSKGNIEMSSLWHKREISCLGSWFFVATKWLLLVHPSCNFDLIIIFFSMKKLKEILLVFLINENTCWRYRL